MMSEDKTARSWIVVSGTGSLEKDGISENLPVNEPVIVSSAFCVTNTGAENLVMIETATGGTSMPMMESV
jgi:mannose-6-phosphate isomerase-like protein (cupin superfamily)